MNNLEKNINDRLKALLEIDDLEEANVTANIDGGEGPIRTPHAFKNVDGTEEEEEPEHDSIEVFDYKKADVSKQNFESKSTYAKMMNQLHLKEASYRDYKRDESMNSKQKVNTAIAEINRLLFEVEKITRQNVRLKTEDGVDNGMYWKGTKQKLSKISERILKIAKQFRDLSA